MFNPVNEINEITAITNTIGTPWPQPTYDPAGNMTTIPWTKPGAARSVGARGTFTPVIM